MRVPETVAESPPGTRVWLSITISFADEKKVKVNPLAEITHPSELGAEVGSGVGKRAPRLGGKLMVMAASPERSNLLGVGGVVLDGSLTVNAWPAVGRILGSCREVFCRAGSP